MEQLRVLGINMGLPGAGIMLELIQGFKKPGNLTKQQRQQVLSAWDTRHFVPEEKLEFVDRVQPEEGLEGEEYEKDYVEKIYKYLQTI